MEPQIKMAPSAKYDVPPPSLPATKMPLCPFLPWAGVVVLAKQRWGLTRIRWVSWLSFGEEGSLVGSGETVGKPGWKEGMLRWRGQTGPPHFHPQRRGRGPRWSHTKPVPGPLTWHNCAIASPFAPRARLPWCGLIPGFLQGPGRVKTAHCKFWISPFSEAASVGELPCLGFILKDLVGNLYLFILQLCHMIQRSHLYSYSPLLLEEG